MAADTLPLLTFPDAAAFESWLAAQPDDARGAWLRFAKQGAPETTIGKSAAIDCALAHRWIDGQLGRVDEPFFQDPLHASPARERLVARGPRAGGAADRLGTHDAARPG